jgi:hypothetical protein
MNRERSAEFFVAAISDNMSCTQLAQLIGLAPDEGWSKGDTYVRREQTKVYRFSRWAFVEHASGSANDWEQAIDKLFSRLRPVQSQFQVLPNEVVVKFGVNLTEDNDVFGFSLSAQQIQFVSSIRGSLDMSVIVAIGRTPAR